MTGRPWIALRGDGWEVGRVGGSSLKFDLGEQPLDTRRDQVVSARSLGDAGSRLIVRALPSGQELFTYDSADGVTSAVFAGNGVFFTGVRVDEADPGVRRLDLTTGIVTMAIAPAAWPESWGGNGVRFRLQVSASGATISSASCGPLMTMDKICRVEVMNVTEGRSFVALDVLDGFVAAVTDRQLITLSHPRDVMTVYDLTGAQLWRLDDRYFDDQYATADFRTLIAGVLPLGGTRKGISRQLLAIDLDTGSSRVLFERPIEELVTLWPELSDDHEAVVGNGPALREAFGDTNRRTGLRVDIESGRVADALVEVVLP